MKNKVFIIAEAGVNHNGSFALAKKLVDVAAWAKADAVKFQSFKAEDLVSVASPMAAYQKANVGKAQTQYAMLKKLELSEESQRELQKYCTKKKIQFLTSPFDMASLDFIASRLRLKIIKIPSGEITNLPLLRKIGALRRKVILSTGMATTKEIAEALSLLMKNGTKKSDITLLHCTTEYPAPFNEVHLRALIALRDRFKARVGYSDHTLGINVPIAAVALGAQVIEKHFTLDTAMKGPDHKASLNPGQLADMVTAIRNIETALGNEEKAVTGSERKNIAVVRKSIVAQRDIAQGETLNEINITCKRPGKGISPMRWDSIIGTKAIKNFRKDEYIRI